MEKTQYIVALEIGSSKIVGAIAEKSPTGYVSVNRLEEQKLSNCVRYGCIQNVENTKNAINRILKMLSNAVDGLITDVYVGINARSVHSEATEVTRNLDASVQITDSMIDKIIRGVHDVFRGYEVIDIVPRAFYVDGSATKTPGGQFGSKIEIKLNQIVAKPNIKLNLERVMSATMKVRQYLVTPLVVSEEILKPDELSLGCMLVDIGAETTSVAIYKNNALQYLTTLPLGGRNLTLDLVNGLQIMEETAERVKKNINNPLDPAHAEDIIIDGVHSKKASEYISARMGEIIVNINRQITNAGLTNDDLRSVVLIGGGSALQGLPEKVNEVTKINVRRGSYPSTLNILDHTINKPEYIELFALLAKGAELLPEGATCLERRSYEPEGPQFAMPAGAPAAAARPQPEQEPQPQPDKKRRSIFGGFKRKLDKLLSESDIEDNDEERDE